MALQRSITFPFAVKESFCAAGNLIRCMESKALPLDHKLAFFALHIRLSNWSDLCGVKAASSLRILGPRSYFVVALQRAAMLAFRQLHIACLGTRRARTKVAWMRSSLLVMAPRGNRALHVTLGWFCMLFCATRDRY